MYIFITNPFIPFKIFSPVIYTSARYNHYNVLSLKRNCTAKEIKEAFIRLSKKYHPDINKSEDAQKKFIAISEAYQTLSDPNRRTDYDLRFRRKATVMSYSDEPHFHYAPDPWKDPSFYHNRDKSQDWYYSQQPYYGIKGLKKVSNLTMALICIGILIVGASLQAVLIHKALMFKRHEMARRSKEAQQTLNQIRHTALTTTKEEQIELLKLRFGQKD